MKQGRWEMYTRGTIHLHRFAMCLRPIEQDSAGKYLKAPIGDLLYVNIGSKLWFAWNRKEIYRYGNILFKIAQSPGKFQKHYGFLKSQCQLANREAEKIRNLNLTRQSNLNLINLYQNLYSKTGKVQILLGAEVDAIDLVFENFLQKSLRSELKSKLSYGEFLALYKNLSTPIYASYVTKQHFDTLTAALRAKDLPSAASRLAKKYWWTPLGWESVSPYADNYFIQQIIRERQLGKIQKKIFGIQSQMRQAKRQRQTEIRKYCLSAKFQHLLNALDCYARLHDLRKEMQSKNVYAFHLLLMETARRLKLKPGDLEWTWYEEACKLLAGEKLNKEEVIRRKRACGVIITNHILKSYSGNAAVSELRKILKIAPAKTNKIKGLGVTGGRAKGRAKVCSGYAEAQEKIKKGDILITGMTLPDYLPAMKKAGAIVTDEGGITCHAAIISRELGKVCVVGTKIATQVYKDGDIVEVDANKGIVKKLSI